MGGLRQIEGKCAHRRRRLRSCPWRAALMRSRTHYLGMVYAPDQKSAKAAAITEFKIAEDMRRRLVVRPDD